jgi:hypothetical protein
MRLGSAGHKCNSPVPRRAQMQRDIIIDSTVNDGKLFF